MQKGGQHQHPDYQQAPPERRFSRIAGLLHAQQTVKHRQQYHDKLRLKCPTCSRNTCGLSHGSATAKKPDSQSCGTNRCRILKTSKVDKSIPPLRNKWNN
ncbi:hypothetical protein [Adhaeribacter soli]|uniref:Uncharacterized protein n=1 Tax=Adhaeribacter soli TaxID=2607655 RepID=A0A5N1ISD9_9BACT|nr:hypothetical protein [Adhaeribacter soli]KAA9331873.1 hypothetical protein F0P94_13830 [Adhaeribacter soli]